MKRPVEFATEDGTLLRGDVHSLGGHEAPGIVMAHGFSGVKEQIDHYAASFAEHGISVLLFDHRGFGLSDGLPRLEVDYGRQVADWRDAISFALDEPEFDSSAGVGVWGSSFAGGLAIVLGAIDDRVRCVVSQVPNVSGPRNARQMFGPAQRALLREAFEQDRAGRLSGEPPRRIPVFSEDPRTMVALPPAMSARHIAAAEARAPSWRNEVTLRSVESMIEFEAAGWLKFLSPKPFLMIVGANDTCTFSDLQLAVFDDASEPKKLVVHPGGHFDTYTEHFAQTSEAATQWFVEHLTQPHVDERLREDLRVRSLSKAS